MFMRLQFFVNYKFKILNYALLQVEIILLSLHLQ